MSDRILLVDLDGSALPNATPPAAQTGTWWPAVYVPPPIPVPGNFAATPLIDGVLLSWDEVALNDVDYIVSRAPDNAGVPGTWAKLVTTKNLQHTVGVGNGVAFWYRVHAKVNGRVSAFSASIKAAPAVATGENLLPDDYSLFEYATLPPFLTTNVVVARDTAQKFIGPASLRYVTSANDAYAYWTANAVYNIKVTAGRKFIVSFYARASAAGVPLQAYLFDGVTHFGPFNAVTGAANTWARYSGVIDLTGTAATQLCLRVDVDSSGKTVHFDGAMVQYQVGSNTEPSPYSRGPSSNLALLALAQAATAQATADGATYIWRQATPPAFPPAAIGDYWIDTANSNKPYYSTNGSSWTDVTDPRIAQGLADAAAAQATANGRIKTWYQEAAPTAAALGDMWYRQSIGVLYRWDGSSWVNTADNTNAVANPNVLNGGFEQGLASWSDIVGAGLAGWYTQAPGALTGTQCAVKFGGANGTSGIVNEARITCSEEQVILVRLAALANSIPISASQGISIGMAFYNAAGTLVHTGTYSGVMDFTAAYCNGAYRSFNKAVSVPSGLGIAYGRAVLIVQGYTGTGAWQFDNVQAFLAEDISTGNNMLKNAAFANGTANWSDLPGGAFPAPESWRAYPFTSNLASGAFAYLYQDVTVGVPGSVGKRVSGSIEVYPVAPYNANTEVYLAVECYSAGYGAQLARKVSELVITQVNAATWFRQLKVHGLLVPANTAIIRFVVSFRGTLGASTPVRYAKLAVEDQASAWTNSVEGNWGTALGTPGSGITIGDQRNLTQSLVNSYGAVRSASALTATNEGGNGKVTVNPHTAFWGGSSAAYAGVTNAIVGLNPGQRYIVYCDDPTFAGGTKVWSVATTQTGMMQLGDGKYVAGEIEIPASSGGTSSGGSGGGSAGSGNDWPQNPP